MSPLSYLKSRIIPLLLVFVTLVLVSLMLLFLGVSLRMVLVLAAIVMASVFCAAAWDYLSKRRFYADLETSLKATNETFYISELIKRPSFYEGQLTYDTIEAATKDMNDRIALYRQGSDEYREFIESWIHEVKTPLAALRLALDNEKTSSGSTTISSMEYDLDRLEGYIELALYYSRSTAVEKDYLIKAVNLDALVKRSVKKHSRALIAAGITPEFEDLDLMVYTDSKWLEFILSQIIINAVKYHRTRSKHHVPRISFSTKRLDEAFEASYIELSITDNGIGIPEPDLSRVFEKGFTGQNGRYFAQSTGIGLYLSKKLCEKMKLRIAVQSQEGAFTTISIIFPLSKMFFLE